MVEMKVYGLALDEASNVPVLVLKDLGEEQTLPIWIGAMEAMAISLVLNNVSLPRPMTHDLLVSLAAALGATITRVEVTRLEAGTYYAEVELDQGGTLRRLDARPSDAVAVALRARCPIFVARAVLDDVARDAEASAAGASPVLKTEEAAKWNDLLEKFSGKDSKYKM
ncbi:bifunctional nuclease family protein [Desulfocurvus sp.]|jgi:bifunctional DNase/RNase|uniref:bifunctional nuclease family protein n=1 Tax=Desulfocurvus sp. TaxID=2871698 RepID=UPI0025C2BA85|nr:bifunctional nuclease family protein [Desulfocurvus sp.]MCK9240329.1 bifunctional nuclease family protein [Desulfocurvus sp.]